MLQSPQPERAPHEHAVGATPPSPGTAADAAPPANAADPHRGAFDRFLGALNLSLRAPAPHEEFFPSREEYAHHAEATVLPARTFASPRLYISGLAATTYHWRDIHERAHAAGGGHSEVHCLRGHDKGFLSMLNVTHREWIADVEAQAVRIRAETGRLPIIHGHSTGALAALAAAAEYPRSHGGEELCAGLILSSPAFELRQNMHRMGLLAARVIRQFSRGAEFWNRFCASLDGGGLDPDIPGQEPPTARWLPVQMLLELEKLRPLAAEAAKTLTVPVFMIHGTADVMANWKTTYSIFKRIPTDDKEIFLVRDGRHSLMFGPHAGAFEEALDRWVLAHQELFNSRDERSLRAHMVRCMRQHWGVREEQPPPPPQERSPRRGWRMPWG